MQKTKLSIVTKDSEEELSQDVIVDDYFKPLVKTWSKDLKEAAVMMTREEMRYLVDAYYNWQENRIRAASQIRNATDAEPSGVLKVVLSSSALLEKRVQQALDIKVMSSPTGQWLRGIYGIGPVIAAGLLAHINIEKATTAGSVWRYAGYDPTIEWKKGEKRPFNADLKVICWKAGQSFMKFHSRDECFYGHLYKKKKEQEVWKNEHGQFAETAARILTEKNWSKDTPTYKSLTEGKLSPAHIDARARRWCVSILLSHLFEIMFWNRYNIIPPRPYMIAIKHHPITHEIFAPNTEMFPEYEAAIKKWWKENPNGANMDEPWWKSKEIG